MRLDIDSKFSAGLPYPPVTVDEKNDKYAKIILQNYAGMVSEFTAIAQYTYQELALMEEFPVISNAIKGIDQVEMKHLQILGKLIVLLGGEPRYCMYKKKTPYYWSPKFVNYSRSLKEILTENIKSENMAIAQYERAIQEIDDANIIAILKRIILDEEYHIKIFNELFSKYVQR